MEREIERIIREKVNGAALMNVSWGKESTWRRIEPALYAKPPRSFFYYVAASWVLITLVLIVSGDFVQQDGLESTLDLPVDTSGQMPENQMIVQDASLATQRHAS